MNRIIRLALTVGSALSVASGSSWAGDAMPFKLFDAHVHLISQDTQRYPKDIGSGPPPGTAPPGGGLPAGVGGQPGGHSGASVRVEPTVEQILHWMDEQGVDEAAAVQKRAVYGYDNSYTLDSTDQHKERLAPVVVLNAEAADTPAKLRELIRNRGVAGIRLTGARAKDGSFPWLSSPQALKTWAVAEETGLAVDLMPLYPGKTPGVIAEIIELAKQHPRVRIVLDHAAWPNLEGAPDYGLDAAHRSFAPQRNIYFKVTTINLDLLREANLPSADFVRHLVDVYGADHVMWGSDLGNSAGSYAEMVGRIVEATTKLTSSEKQYVLHDTAYDTFVRGGTAGPGPLSLDAAQEAASAAIEACRKNGYKVTVTVLTRSGRTAVVLHDDGADLRSLQNSRRKAAAAHAFHLSSSEYGKRVASGAEGSAAFDPERFSTSNGGFPLLIGDEIVGAIGVSGAPGGDKDAACAQAGVDRFFKKLSKN